MPVSAQLDPLLAALSPPRTFPAIDEGPNDPLTFGHIETCPPRSPVDTSDPAPSLCPAVIILDTPPPSPIPFVTADPLIEITRAATMASGKAALTKGSQSEIQASTIVVEGSGEGRCQLEEHPSTSVFEETTQGEPQLDAQRTTSVIGESDGGERQLDAAPSTTVIEESELGEPQLDLPRSTTVIEESELGEPQLEVPLSTTIIEETEMGEPQLEAQPSTSGGALVVYKGSQSELLASSSVVDIIPADCTTPEAAKNVPGSVKRYLQRWPRGTNRGDPRFDYTTLHESSELTLATYNNDEDAKRRADLLQAVPTHVHVSLTPQPICHCAH